MTTYFDLIYKNVQNALKKKRKLWRKYDRPRAFRPVSYPYIQTQMNVCINKLKTKLAKYLESQHDYFLETKSNLAIDNKYGEWLGSKFFEDSKMCGAGSTPYDVLTDNDIGVDVACMCINGNQSNEKSVLQKFSDRKRFEKMFADRKDEEIVSAMTTHLVNKWGNLQCNDLYIMCFISDKVSVKLVFLKINPYLIKLSWSDGFSPKGVSVYVGGIINPDYGWVKIYKSKDRMELKLTRKCIDKWSIQVWP